MLRFYMPKSVIGRKDKAKAIREQLENFLVMEPLQDLLKILKVDIDSIGEVYNGRLKADGTVVETQELFPLGFLEEKRERLYPIFRELGFIDINKPLEEENSHIIVLGGSLTASFDRTAYAKKWIDDKTRCVDALACFRPVNPSERSTSVGFSRDTEFGVLSESFVRVFELTESEATERFKGDRNLNSVSCIKEYKKNGEKRKYRIIAAPSSEPHLRRADTGDTLKFYMESAETVKPGDRLLFVTNNRYCNRQFLQLAYQMIKEDFPGSIDTIGCFSDERITGVNSYDPFQYLQDLIGIIDWIYRFREI